MLAEVAITPSGASPPTAAMAATAGCSTPKAGTGYVSSSRCAALEIVPQAERIALTPKEAR